MSSTSTIAAAPLLITAEEVGHLTGFSPITINNWAYCRRPPPAGFPPPLKLGGRIRWRVADIVEWVNGIEPSLPPRIVARELCEQPPRRPRGRPRKLSRLEQRARAAVEGGAA